MSPFVWLGVAAVMGVVEIVSLSLITMWFVVGALVAFAASLLGADLVVQLVVFLVVSVACLVGLRPDVYKRQNSTPPRSPSSFTWVWPVRSALPGASAGGSSGVMRGTWPCVRYSRCPSASTRA